VAGFAVRLLFQGIGLGFASGANRVCLILKRVLGSAANLISRVVEGSRRGISGGFNLVRGLLRGVIRLAVASGEAERSACDSKNCETRHGDQLHPKTSFAL
jgi:hypothetical protein